MTETIDFLLAKYGPRMNIDQVAKATGLAAKTLRARRSGGRACPAMVLDGGRLFASTAAVADYLDKQAAKASANG